MRTAVFTCSTPATAGSRSSTGSRTYSSPGEVREAARGSSRIPGRSSSTRAGRTSTTSTSSTPGTTGCRSSSLKSQTGQIAFLESWGSLGSRDGDFKYPRDITLDGEGNLWVLDSGNERVQKFRFDTEAGSRFCRQAEIRHLRRFVSSASWGKFFGSRGGKFDDLVSIGWSRDRFGYIYLLGAGCLVQQFQLDGTLVNSWPAIAPESGLCSPGRIEVDNKNDYVYVLDAGNGLFERFNLEGRFLFALRGAERPFAKPARDGGESRSRRVPRRRHGEQHRAEVHPALIDGRARRTDGSDHAQGGTMSKRFGIAAAVLGGVLARFLRLRRSRLRKSRASPPYR